MEKQTANINRSPLTPKLVQRPKPRVDTFGEKGRNLASLISLRYPIPVMTDIDSVADNTDVRVDNSNTGARLAGCFEPTPQASVD